MSYVGKPVVKQIDMGDSMKDFVIGEVVKTLNNSSATVTEK